MTYVIVAVTIGLIVLLHELGHLLLAKAVGLPVAVFSIGLGPRLAGWQLGETEYRLSAIPFGGFVMPEVEDEEAFFAVAPVKRILFSLGGPLANLVTAFAILTVLNVVVAGHGLVAAVGRGVSQTLFMFMVLLRALPMLFQSPDQLSGIVGIVAQGSTIVQGGPVQLASLAAFLSMNFAVLNLLPIPILDGGQALLTALEKLTPNVSHFRVPLALLSWLLMLGLMVYATYLDITRLV